MSSEASGPPTTAVDEELIESLGRPITRNVVLAGMTSGLLGTILMLPVLVGIPALLGLFQTEPVLQFAGFAEVFGLQPTLLLGVVLFGIGGTVVLPLTFLVVGAFLPPMRPRYLRGVTFATAFWFGFLPAFWPSGGLLTTISYVVFSLVAHWVYGLTLGIVLTRATGLPQHTV